MKKRLIFAIAVALLLILTFTSCQWFNTEEPHECESACPECGKCLDAECAEGACADKCPGHHKCEHVCKECNGCLDAECTEKSCKNKCSCHNKDLLCPECGGCVYTGCKEAICMKKCSCPKYVNVDEGLVAALSNHLEHIDVQYDLVFSNTETKIDDIKYGRQPLLVTFNNATTYYVGVYFYGEHHNDPNYPLESGLYCCSDHYVWVRFDSAEEITRTYNNRNLLAAFVISETESVTNILSEDAKPQKFVLFNMFYRFLFMEDEIEVPDISSEPFIYLNRDVDADTIYYYQKSYNRRIATLPCAEIDGRYYIIFRKFTVNAQDIAEDFGKYYAEMSEVMSTEIYIYTDEYGHMLECYLIEVEDFAEVIKGE